MHILAECGGNKSRAARVLGIDYKTLLRKLPA
ncbi:MAG: helix-turn-helix domain-containing protein [Thiobacillus sp.]